MREHKSILIVEDEAIVALDLRMLLESAGYTIIRICNSSDQLFSELENPHKPDLILMDVHINGELDGLESSLRVKKLYDIPVIFLTAYADKNTISKAKSSYPYGYIIKPYDKQRLLIIIEMGLNIIELEKRVKKREELFSATFNSIGDAVIITDHSNVIHYLNPAAQQMAGRQNCTGIAFFDVFPIEFEKNENRGILFDSEGREKTLEIKKNDLPSSIFDMGGYVWILNDITIPLFLEAQLRESHKMEAVGRLAGGVAHDFNNLLTVIMGFCSLILDNTDLMEKEKNIKNDVMGIQSTSRKAVKLTRQLMTFSENQIHNPRNIDLNTIIDELDSLLTRLIPDNITLNIKLSSENLIVKIDPVQLEQVIVNLIVNARDAVDKAGGQVLLSTELLVLKESKTLINGRIPQGEYIVLKVEDNGMGVPLEIQKKIFEPFFTTKKGEKGIGLGLSTVYGIIQHSSCFLDMTSREGEGTCFALYFPRIEDPLPSVKTKISHSVNVMGKESVLVVEEDEYVRSIMTRILKKKKYSVSEAGSAGEAILLCEKRNDPFDLLITDMFMPLISGQELSRRISAYLPHIKTLYTSTTAIEKEELKNFIQKPFDPDDFALLVRKCLDSN